MWYIRPKHENICMSVSLLMWYRRNGSSWNNKNTFGEIFPVFLFPMLRFHVQTMSDTHIFTMIYTYSHSSSLSLLLKLHSCGCHRRIMEMRVWSGDLWLVQLFIHHQSSRKCHSYALSTLIYWSFRHFNSRFLLPRQRHARFLPNLILLDTPEMIMMIL
jgi:hypothetical protein